MVSDSINQNILLIIRVFFHNEWKLFGVKIIDWSLRFRYLCTHDFDYKALNSDFNDLINTCYRRVSLYILITIETI